MEDRFVQIKEAGLRLAESAAKIKEVADQLRRDVDLLTERVANVEKDAGKAHNDIDVAKKVVEGEQAIQDGRLDTLES